MNSRIIETTELGQEKLAELIDNIDMCSGLIIEMFEQNQLSLLSPLFRKMILQRGKKLRDLYFELKHNICLDYLKEKETKNEKEA